jgi:hypothetical protein
MKAEAFVYLEGTYMIFLVTIHPVKKKNIISHLYKNSMSKFRRAEFI